MFTENGNFFLLSSAVEATMVLSLEISGLSYVNPSAMRQFFIFFDVRWSFSFHHVFSDAGSTKHHCLGLNWAAYAATSLALCKQVSVLPFFVHSMSFNKDMNMIR